MKVKRLVCMSLVVAMFLLVYLFGSLIAIPAKAATQERDVSYSADYTINSEYIDSYLETKDVAEDDGRIQELFMERSDVASIKRQIMRFPKFFHRAKQQPCRHKI